MQRYNGAQRSERQTVDLNRLVREQRVIDLVAVRHAETPGDPAAWLSVPTGHKYDHAPYDGTEIPIDPLSNGGRQGCGRRPCPLRR